MAKRTKKAVNKSAFVRDFITSNPEANRRAVEEAWLEAGHEGVISSALVSNLRTKLGLTGNLKNHPDAETESTTTSAPSSKKYGKPRGTTGKGRGNKPKHAPVEANGTAASHGSLEKLTTSSGEKTAGRGGNQGKSAFVVEHLQQNLHATDDEITEAWATAGNEGGISGSLIYKIRAKEGLTGKRGPKGRGAVKKGPAKSSPRGDRAPEPMAETSKTLDKRANRGRVVAELEGDIDRLIFKLMGIGGLEEIEDVLRKVRRRLILSHGQ